MPAFSTTRTFMPLALIAAVAVTCLQGAAFAGGVPMEPTHHSVQVPIAGLNLANPADVAKLDDRIQRAARSVCSSTNYRDLRAMSDRPACIAAAVDNANARRDVLVARAQGDQLAARAQSAVLTD